MTQGVFIYGERPDTKKALKGHIEQVNTFLASGGKEGADPYSVVIEATSMFGNEFDGSLAKAMNCKDPDCPNAVPNLVGSHENIEVDWEPHQHPGPFYLVGPDPYNSRKWYASLTYDPDTDPPEWRIK